MATLAIGMRVKLKSGGPVMTLLTAPSDASPRVYCEWTEGGQGHMGAFDSRYLIEVGQ